MEKMEFQVLLIQFVISGIFAAPSLTDKGVLQSEATKLDRSLVKALDDVSARNELKKLYTENESKYGKVSSVDAEKLVSELAANLQAILDKKVKAIEKAVDFAEKIAAEYRWDKDLQLDEVTERFVDAKLINESADGYQYDEKFKQKVNFENSSVHIPVEIYKGGVPSCVSVLRMSTLYLDGLGFQVDMQGTDVTQFGAPCEHVYGLIIDYEIGIMNGLMWTNKLDEIWMKNKQEDPDLLWQYFGSQTGIMRNFPASKWRGENPDLYDVRRRPWYTQGASSPKDMFILIDTSGSTHGQALALMKQSVISILETLGENDFVNIGHFALEAKLVACFDTFVQANHWNKQILINKVNGLEAHNMAKYAIGFEFAFKEFEKFYNESSEEDNGQSARCNRIIMFLTDGGTDMPEDVFRKYNWNKGNKTRIFSYAVGPTANPVAAARWIACANRGFFYKIPAMGAIRSAVQDYVSVIARPMAAEQPRYNHFSSIYADRISDYTNTISKPMSWAPRNTTSHWSDIYLDSFGLGMMTTVTMPVYNAVNWTEDSSNQTILGVMGSDVTVSDLEKHIPQKQLGPNGYAFALNTNGYIVFHPNLKAVNGYLRDPPNVDFLDVEYSPLEKIELRKKMIDQKKGSQTINALVVVSDEKHIDWKPRRYYFTGVDKTSFSVGIVLPENKTHYWNLTDAGIDMKKGIDSLRGNTSAIFLAPWDFCENVTLPENITWYTTLEEMINTMLNDSSKCKQHLLQHLFFDSIMTKPMEQTWAGSVKTGFDTVFVGTDSGLTRVYSPNMDDSIERFDSIKDVWNEVYYKRSMDNSDQWMFWASSNTVSNASVYINENTTAPLVTATKAISLNNLKPAVIGVQMTQDEVRKIIKRDVADCRKEGMFCYLLDDAGLLVTSTDETLEQKYGLPFEQVEPVLMSKLLQKDILVQHVHYDYQGVCKPERQRNNAGFRSVVPHAIFELLSIKWWTTKVAWAYFNFNIYHWVSSLFNSNANQVAASEEDYLQRNNSCIKKGAQYYKSNTSAIENHFKDWTKCGSCESSMFASKLSMTNLVIVVVNDACKESSCEKIIREYEEDTDPNFSPLGTCNVTRRYRRRPVGCYDFNPNEENRCGGGSVIKTNIYFVIVATIVSMVVSKSLATIR